MSIISFHAEISAWLDIRGTWAYYYKDTQRTCHFKDKKSITYHKYKGMNTDDTAFINVILRIKHMVKC